MTITVLPYSLPDAMVFSDTGDQILVWQPNDTYIVLGQSNTTEKSLIADKIIEDQIEVTRRPTGGEAVVLTRKMIVITVAREVGETTGPREFFREINRIIMEALADLGVRGLGANGISDITIGNRKILGSSMHRSDGRLVYHAVLNIGEDPAIFEKYLRHPGREPGYRQNRSHSEFVTSLKGEGYNISYGDLAILLNSYSTHQISF